MTSFLHRVRDSLMSKEREYSLSEATLTSTVEGSITQIPYSEIKQISLITYANFGGEHGQATLHTKSGQTLKVRSHHYASVGNFENRSATYVPLVRELITRVANANHSARFQSGSGTMRMVWLLSLIVSIVMSALLMVALLSGEPLKGNVIGALVMVVVLIPFVWRRMRNSRPVSFAPDDVPAELFEL